MIKRVVLENGLRLIVREMRSSPVVAMNLWVGSGSADDPDELGGISHFAEHMLFRGVDGGRGSDLAHEVHDAGGYLNAETGCDHTMYYQVVPSAGWQKVLTAVVESVAAPAFRGEDVEGERGVVVEEARSGESDPGVFVWRRLMEAAFPDHPCRRPIVGTPESVARVTPDALREHHAAHYGARNLVQVIVGDVDSEEAIEFASALLTRLPAGEERRVGRPVAPHERGLKALAYEGPVDQPYVALAFGAPHAVHPDVPALDALCGLLGVGRSSRLASSLRDRDGLVSDVSCGLVAYRDTGLVAIRAVASNDDVDRVCEGIFRETERLRETPPSPAEMEKNLRRLEAGYVLEHETPDSIANTLGFFETLGDYTWADEYIDRLARVEVDDVLRVARMYLRPEGATFVSYASGAIGGQGVDRSTQARSTAERAAVAARESRTLREDGASWSAPRAFSRPDVLRETGRMECTRLELLGGGNVVVCDSPALPIVSVTIGFSGGFFDEPVDKGGLTYVATRMALQGTERRSAERISEDIEGLGSALATAVERDGFGVGYTVLAKHLEEATGIVGDVLVNASFPESRVEHVQRQVVSEIIAAMDHPLRRAITELLPLAFPGLPYGRPIRGTLESVRRASVRELADWHRKTCTADRLCVCVVGDVRPERARDVIGVALSSLPLRGEPGDPARRALGGAGGIRGEPGAHAETGVRPSGGFVGELTGAQQSVITVALAGPPGGTPDAVAARVVVRALSMMGGRFWRSLRERPPHAYHVGGMLLSYASAGATVGYATSAPGDERAVSNGIVTEFERLVDTGLTRSELDRTKRHLAGSLEVSLMRGAARSASYAMSEVMGVGYERVRDLAAAVRDVTNDDVVRVARTYMNPADGFAEAVLRGEPSRS